MIRRTYYTFSRIAVKDITFIRESEIQKELKIFEKEVGKKPFHWTFKLRQLKMYVALDEAPKDYIEITYDPRIII